MSLRLLRWAALWSLLAARSKASLSFNCCASLAPQVLMHIGRTLPRISCHSLGFMAESVTGHCYARGALVQGLGFWLITAAAASAVATVLLTAFGLDQAASWSGSLNPDGLFHRLNHSF
ncbi:hypothetical protein BZM26_09465 [Paraburkholderia strydomiana]|nr:hypothetical protein BZM26_09465 [Paraburkholderia strydomiana]